MPDKQGIPVPLLHQLYGLGATFRRLEGGIVVFQHPEYWLLTRQFSYDRVVRVSLDTYANRTCPLSQLFEQSTPITLP